MSQQRVYERQLDLETKITSDYLKSISTSKLYFQGLRNGQDYINTLYRDLILKMRDVSADEIVEAYSTAMEV